MRPRAEEYLPKGVVAPSLGVFNFGHCRATPRPGGSYRTRHAIRKATAMIILGIVLLIAGFLLKISILWTIGIVHYF